MNAAAFCEFHPLEELNTLAVPARARWFVEAVSESQMLEALEVARQQMLPVLVLGGGSNVLLPELYQGLVILNRMTGRETVEEGRDDVLLSVASGENWHNIVMHCVARGWWGLENLALIPGSVGAAPVQNIGAYGVELEQVFESLEAVHIKTGKRRTFSRQDCDFAYRHSVFKQAEKGEWLILRVQLRLGKTPRAQIHYPVLQQYFAEHCVTHPDAGQVARAVMAIRQSKLPDPGLTPNAGSFFKNPLVSKAVYQQLLTQYPGLVAYPAAEDQFKLAAAWLVEKAGWKGKIEQGMGMHGQQALVLTNPGHNSRQSLLAFAARVQESVQGLFGVCLDIEPDIV